MFNLITDTNRKWWILAAMSIGMAMSFIDQTAISVTLPSLQRTFHTTATTLQWVIDIYLLVIAVLVVIGGRLGDLFQYRRLYFIGAIIFLMASLLCALAPDIIFLISSRALQGIGAAILIPSSMVLTLNAFDMSERGKAMGMSVGFASLFLAIGPFLGGLFTQLMSWRLVFWINVPFTIMVLIIIHYAIKNDVATAKHSKLDWQGFITLIIATTAIVLALMEGINWGWHSHWIIGLFITGIIFAALFYYSERWAVQPLIDFTIFHNKIFLGAALIYFCMQIALMSMVFGAIYNQTVLDFKPAIAGLLALPSTLPIMFMGPLAGRMLDKYGLQRPVIIGLALTFIGMLLNGYLVYYQNYWYLLPGMLCNGFGIPLVMSPMGTAAISSIDRAQQGVASGMLNATRQLGGCIGLALLSAIIISYDQYHIANFLAANQQTYSNITVQQVENLLAHSGSGQFNQLIPIAKANFASAYGLGLHVSTIILLIALVIAWRLLKRVKK